LACEIDAFPQSLNGPFLLPGKRAYLSTHTKNTTIIVVDLNAITVNCAMWMTLLMPPAGAAIEEEVRFKRH